MLIYSCDYTLLPRGERESRRQTNLARQMCWKVAGRSNLSESVSARERERERCTSGVNRNTDTVLPVVYESNR